MLEGRGGDWTEIGLWGGNWAFVASHCSSPGRSLKLLVARDRPCMKRLTRRRVYYEGDMPFVHPHITIVCTSMITT